MPPKDKYTDPKLRDQVKKEIQDGDKGGAPGQWSARKAQMMASEYKKRGGDYNTDKSEKDESQKNLDKWGEEDWQTKEGSGKAKKEDGTEKRYLPKKAWERMTDEEKEKTDQKKQKESKEGKQHVSNTDNAKESRKKATSNGSERNGRSKADEEEQNEKHDDDTDKDEGADDDDGDNDEEYADGDDDGEQDDDKDQESEEDADDRDDQDEDEDEEDEGSNEKASAGQKRSKQSNGASKKQKSNTEEGKQSNGTVGSKHQSAEEPAPRGSKDRLPKKGQQIHWKAMPGYVDGKVVEILTQNKDVDGKSFKASKTDPKVVLKSNSSGKICVHKPDACFFD